MAFLHFFCDFTFILPNFVKLRKKNEKTTTVEEAIILNIFQNLCRIENHHHNDYSTIINLLSEINSMSILSSLLVENLVN